MRAAVRLPCFELLVTVPRSGADGVAIGGCWGEDREAEGGLAFAEDRAPGTRLSPCEYLEVPHSLASSAPCRSQHAWPSGLVPHSWSGSRLVEFALQADSCLSP